MVALLSLAPWLTTHTQLTTGDLVGGVVYLMQGLAPAVGFLASGGTGWLVQLALISERLASDIQVTPQGDVPAEPARLGGNGAVAADGPLHLRAYGLTFAYSPQARPVFEDVTLDLAAGAHVAFVGPSGVGKSTLAALLAGVRRPQRGTVTLGGVGLEAWPESTLRQTVAYAPQESYVFAGTVLENLCYLNADDERSSALLLSRADEAVVQFGLESTVERLGGLEGEIETSGDGLSAGER